MQGVRPIAHWRRFKIWRQALVPGNSAGRVTDTCYQRLHSHTGNKRTQQFRACCSIYGKVSRRKDKWSKWLHPASLLIKTIVWRCLAAGVDAAVLESKEKANKRRRKAWSWISLKLLFSLRSASFDVSTWGRSSPPPALAPIGQDPASGVRNRINSIPRDVLVS